MTLFSVGVCLFFALLGMARSEARAAQRAAEKAAQDRLNQYEAELLQAQARDLNAANAQALAEFNRTYRYDD